MTLDTTPSDEEQLQQAFNWVKEKVKKQQLKSTISNYKRGLEWDEEQLNGTEPLEDINLEHFPKKTIIDIKEKQFRVRFSYFSLRSLLLSVGISIAITAPITFPWLFEFVMPDIMALIPPFLADIIEDMIKSIQSFLTIFAWAEPIIKFLMQIAATFNPFLVYMTIMYILNSTEIIHDEYYEDPLADLSNIPSAADFFASDFQMKFNLSFTEIAVFLFLVSFFISLFLVIRGEREVIYEFFTKKEEEKFMEEVEEAFIGYYKDKGYEKVNYIENRFSESPNLIYIAYLVKLSPILSFFIPLALAMVFLIL
ncbi:MAG: hypothetical protein JSW11_07570 [Candidatus Heimdallarchaeota archaeon]|nr:MAG: hypothetical protein JSW11_07570 [Candidatus Heimdallarchaeota archaeon]